LALLYACAPVIGDYKKNWYCKKDSIHDCAKEKAEKADFDSYHKEDGFHCCVKLKEDLYHKWDSVDCCSYCKWDGVDCCSKKMMVYVVQLLW